MHDVRNPALATEFQYKCPNSRREPAAALGMATVWMKTDAEWAQGVAREPHIHDTTGDIKGRVEQAIAVRTRGGD